MSSEASKHEDRIGYGRPPTSTRFQKGRSGNPKGRPRARRREISHDAVLGQMVTVREDGRERRVTAAEAFLLQLVQKGLAGDSAAARASLAAIEAARAKQPDHASTEIIKVVLVGMANDTAAVALGLLNKKHANDEQLVQCELQPWIVEAALARFGTPVDTSRTARGVEQHPHAAEGHLARMVECEERPACSAPNLGRSL